MSDSLNIIDAIVVGGGPAGLSAALLLGRCCRSVTIFDDGHPRNAAATNVHAYLGLENVEPAELIATGRRQLSVHPNVKLMDQRVTSVCNRDGIFHVRASSGMVSRSRGLILATGLVDQLPKIENLSTFFGKTAHVCPYCDGWESIDEQIGVWGSGIQAAEFALEMLLWTSTVSLFLDGPDPDHEVLQRMDRVGITVFFSTSARAFGSDGKLEALELADGRRIKCRRLFLAMPQKQPNSFLQDLGCGLNERDQAECGSDGSTSIMGLFIAGNAGNGIELAMVAAAEGLKAAAALNDWLLTRKEDH